MIDYFDRLMKRFNSLVSIPLNPSAAIIIALYTFMWGLWLASPFWQVFTRAPLYSALSSVMPELYWGLIAIGCGWFMTYGVVRGVYRWLSRGAFVGFVHWIVISGGYFVGDWQNTGGITSLAIAAYCGIIYLNLRVNRDNLPLERKRVKI